MGIDYYKVLKVNRNATYEDLKKSYRRLAMQWHPDKNLDDEEAKTKFQEISEAYYVLSDPQKKAIYDQNGEEGLKVGTPGSSGGCSSNHSNNFKFNPTRTVEEIFGEFFGPGVFRFGTSGPERVKPGQSGKPPCILEELYTGPTKKMKISREVVDVSGRLVPKPKLLIANVEPVWKKETKISFANKGNKKPNNVYQRDRNDLIVTKKISLLEALVGTTVNVKSLGGRELNIPVTDVVSPGYELVVADEGMPNFKERGIKGNLRIKFEVKFPTRLSPEQKAGIMRILGD